MTTGEQLKIQLGLKYIPNVQIGRVLITTYRVYLIMFDSRRPEMPLTRARMVKAPMPSMLYKYPFTERPKIAPFIPIEEYNGALETPMFFVIDLAGYFQDDSLYDDEKLIESENKKSYLCSFYGKLEEFTTIDDLKANAFSDITKKHYGIRKSSGNKGTFLYKVKWDEKKNYVLVVFTVIPTFDKKVIAFKPTGQQYNARSYRLGMKFLDANKHLGSKEDFSNMSPKEQSQLVMSMLKNAYVQVWSSDPSFFFQGMWEGLDRVDATIYPFPGPAGRDEWIRRHGKDGININKHFRELFSVIYNLYNDITINLRKEL